MIVTPIKEDNFRKCECLLLITNEKKINIHFHNQQQNKIQTESNWKHERDLVFTKIDIVSYNDMNKNIEIAHFFHTIKQEI